MITGFPKSISSRGLSSLVTFACTVASLSTRDPGLSDGAWELEFTSAPVSPIDWLFSPVVKAGFDELLFVVEDETRFEEVTVEEAAHWVESLSELDCVMLTGTLSSEL